MVKPKLSLLDQGDCLRIHRASCDILHRTGVRVHNQEGLGLLRQAGARVEDDLLKIPPSLVEWALASVPGKFNLYRRGSDQIAIALDGEGMAFGPGSDTLHYLDPRSGERRSFTLQDVGDCLLVCDALTEIGFVMSVGQPADVPAERVYRYQFAAMLRYTVNPIVFVCNDRTDIEVISAMAAAVAWCSYRALSDAAMKHLETTEAHALLQERPEAVFIDCRSEIEYLFVGHPVGAIHIAWQDVPDWDINPDFLGHSRKAASANRPVVVICRSGRRSVEAGRYLEKYGFPEVYNVLHGFEGDMNESRHRSTRNGWRFEGLPWEQT